MRTDASSKFSAPRLAGISALVLGALVTLLIGFTGGAGASGHDLVLTKSDSPDPGTQGSNMTYTIQVQNTGAQAQGVLVTDTLPSQIDFVSATSTQGTCDRTGDIVTCNIGTMAAGTTATVTIVIQPKKTGTISNTALVASTPPDTNAANNQETDRRRNEHQGSRANEKAIDYTSAQMNLHEKISRQCARSGDR